MLQSAICVLQAFTLEDMEELKERSGKLAIAFFILGGGAGIVSFITVSKNYCLRLKKIIVLFVIAVGMLSKGHSYQHFYWLFVWKLQKPPKFRNIKKTIA